MAGATSTFAVSCLTDLTGSGESRPLIAGLPGQPPICGPGGEYFGHEWSRWRYDTLDARVDAWLCAIAPGATILDLGCASGARAAAFAQAGHRVVAIDCVDQSAAIAGRNAALAGRPAGGLAPPILFEQADLRAPMGVAADRTLDLIHLRRVLNFLTLEQFAARLDALLPRLAEAGWFVTSFVATGIADAAAMTAPQASGGSGPGPALYPGFHAHPFGDVVRLLQDHGLTVVEAFSDWAVEAGLVARKASGGLCGSERGRYSVGPDPP